MRPLALSLEGFGAFRGRVDIDFTDADLVALVGPTGSGKSTIIDAITFALYGSVARYDDHRAVAPVINQTAAHARVALDFEVAGRRYRAARVVRRTKQGATTPEARLEQDDVVLAADARGVTDAVTGLLGLDAAQFNKTVVLPQGRFAEFLHDKPAQRQATLRNLLDLGLYERMGRAARQRAATAKAQADADADDIGALAATLTDDHRRELAAAVTAVEAAAAEVAAATAELERIDRELQAAEESIAELAREQALLAAISGPPDLDRLDSDRRAAVAELDAATTRLDRARLARRNASEAAAAGPDPVAARLQQEVHAAHRTTRASLARAADALDRARQDAAVASDRAATVRTRLATLEQAVVEAREHEQRAQQDLDAGPDEVGVRELLAEHDRRDAAVARLTDLLEAAGAATRAADVAGETRRRADADAHARRAELDQALIEAGAAGLVGALRIGDDCPVCRQTVHAIPASHGAPELDGLRRALDEAERAGDVALRHHEAANHRVAATNAEVELVRQAIASADQALAGRPGPPELREALEALGQLRDDVRAARAHVLEAQAAWDAARAAPATVAALAGAERANQLVAARAAAVEEQERQLAELADRLVGVPDEAEVLAAVAEAERLAKCRQQADDEFTRAEADHADAGRRRARVEERERAARAALATARDRVATLDPPVLDAVDVQAAWTALSAWSTGRLDSVSERRQAAEERRAQATAARHELVRSTQVTVAAVVADPSGSLAAWREALAARRAEALSAVHHFDAERARLRELEDRARDRREQAAVADSLGRLLSATGFEAWLMTAALDELCRRATTRLRALSGGQFSLVLRDRELLVRDHHHADELRGVRTLSGGETFLASLALALALAEATAELAPAGAPTIESIFLDEGFGTLDPDTLDTVAGAIEDLGASGRMVAIVTHIRELADRMPVRLEVAKSPGGSTVTRVDV